MCECVFVGFVIIVISGGDPGTADAEFALRCAVAGQVVAVFIDDLEFDAEGRAALLAVAIDDLFGGEGIKVGRGGVIGADGAHFGHAPAVVDAAAVFHPEGFDEGGRER